MTTPISNWTDGYLALRRRAVDVRGLAQLDTEDGRVEQWPRTTGADAIEIAALFDPGVRSYSSPGLQRRWAQRLKELGLEGVHEPAVEYPENRTYWRALQDLAVFFDDVTAPSPRQGMWDALLDRIGAIDELHDIHRNVGPTEDGPFAHFEGIKTYDDLWSAQKKYLAQKRGSDKLPPPPGFGMGQMDIPRTTNQDVLQLATYWTHQLAEAKQVMGYAGVMAKWKVASADVDRFAKIGKPDEVYPKNNEFWRTALEVAIQIAIADEAPSKWDLFVGSVKDSITHLPETLEHAGSAALEVVGEAAHATGKVVGEAGKGLLGGLGTPVLIGGGLLAGYLLLRRRQTEEA